MQCSNFKTALPAGTEPKKARLRCRPALSGLPAGGHGECPLRACLLLLVLVASVLVHCVLSSRGGGRALPGAGGRAASVGRRPGAAGAHTCLPRPQRLAARVVWRVG